MKVLVVEDSQRIRESLVRGLKAAGYAVDGVSDGREGFVYGKTRAYDVIILDLGLPKLDGLDVLEKLREGGSTSQILVLTARDSVEDRVSGLRAGADDYLVKPFAFEELLARVEVLVRRRYSVSQPTVRVGELEVDPASRTAMFNQAPLNLTPREFAILEYLAVRAGTVVSRGELDEHVYEDNKHVLSNALDSAVCLIRKKLAQHGGAGLIKTRRGLGYEMPVAGGA